MGWILTLPVPAEVGGRSEPEVQEMGEKVNIYVKTVTVCPEHYLGLFVCYN